MTGLVDRLGGPPPDRLGGPRFDQERAIDEARLADRIAALGQFLDAASGHLPENRLVPARTVVERASQRLAHSRTHTVVALAGSSGSGKSSLFNALARMRLSPVGVRRPTTAATYACVWGPAAGADELLDWLGLPPRYRFIRESALDGEDEAALRGLVLLDLPDFDSVEVAHRAEVDRLLGLVDLVVWVVDPQKYADKVVHETYFSQLHRHQDVTIIALNQADRLSPADQQRCLADLRGLLEVEGLSRVTTLLTSAVGAPGDDQLRRVLETAVASQRAMLNRLTADVDRVVADLSSLVGPAAAVNVVSGAPVTALVDALADAAGESHVAQAAHRAYQARAKAALGWPIARLLYRTPVGRLLPRRPTVSSTVDDTLAEAAVLAPPEPTAAQRAAIGLAVRTIAEQAGTALPAPWPAAVATAARAGMDAIPDALRRAVARAGASPLRTPTWWRVADGVQWFVALIGLVGLIWLVVGQLADLLTGGAGEYPRLGGLPLPAMLLLAGLLGGLLLAGVLRLAVWAAAHRAGRRAAARLRAQVAAVGYDCVLAAVRGVRQAYVLAWSALRSAS